MLDYINESKFVVNTFLQLYNDTLATLQRHYKDNLPTH